MPKNLRDGFFNFDDDATRPAYRLCRHGGVLRLRFQLLQAFRIRLVLMNDSHELGPEAWLLT